MEIMLFVYGAVTGAVAGFTVAKYQAARTLGRLADKVERLGRK